MQQKYTELYEIIERKEKRETDLLMRGAMTIGKRTLEFGGAREFRVNVN